MSRRTLEQAFNACQNCKDAWLTCRAGWEKAEMALKERELTGISHDPEALQTLREVADQRKQEVKQSARQYIHAHEAVQDISMQQQLRAFMSAHGKVLADILAPELMHMDSQPERVRLRALDRAMARIREALSVYLAEGMDIEFAQDDSDILTAIGYRPDRASRTDNQLTH